MMITTLVVSFLVCCRSKVRCGQPGHYPSLTARNLQPTANQERNDQCGNQHCSRELLMMGIVVPETWWAYKKYNKIISGIYLVFILQKNIVFIYFLHLPYRGQVGGAVRNLMCTLWRQVLQGPGKLSKIRHGRFLLNPFKFIKHVRIPFDAK